MKRISMKTQFAAFATALTVATISPFAALAADPSCATCQKNAQPPETKVVEGLSNVAEKVYDAIPDDCRADLNTRDEQMLKDRLQTINEAYFAGKMSASDRTSAFEKAEKDINPKNSKRLKGLFKAAVAVSTQSCVSKLIALKAAKQEPFSKEEQNALKEAAPALDSKVLAEQVKASKEQQEQQIKAVEPFVKDLASYGIKADLEKKTVDVTGINLKPEDLKKNPRLFIGLSLIDPKLVQQLKDAGSEAIIYGDQVILPTQKVGPQAGHMMAISKAQYEKEVNQTLQKYSSAVEEFAQKSKLADTKWSNAVNAKTTPEDIDKENARNKIRLSFNRLTEHYGVPHELKKQLLELQTQAYQLESANIDKGLAKLTAARNSLAALGLAFFMPGLAGKAALSAAGGIMAFSGVSAMVMAGIDSWQLGGSYLCHLVEQVEDHGFDTLTMAAVLAALPVAMEATAGAVGGLTTKLSTLAQGASAAKGVLTAGNIGVGAFFTGQMAIAGVKGADQCYEGFKERLHMSSNERADKKRVINAETTKKCVQALVDLAFAYQSGKHSIKGVMEGRRAASAEKAKEADSKSPAKTEETKTADVKSAEDAAAEAAIADLDIPQLSKKEVQAIKSKKPYKEIFKKVESEESVAEAIAMLEKRGMKPNEVADLFKRYDFDLKLFPEDVPIVAEIARVLDKRITEAKTPEELAKATKERDEELQKIRACNTPGSGAGG